MNKAIIGIDKSGSFRVYFGISTGLAEEARKTHNTTPTATAALGRVLTGASLMGLMLKNPKDKLTIQFKGDGSAGEILSTAVGTGKVKGYISNPDADLPLREDGKLDVGGIVGIGTLTIIKDQGLKEPYVGRIDLVSGEIAEDLTAYFFLSEQQSTSVALGVKVDVDGSVMAAGGMIIQMLPDADPASIDALEALVEDMPSFTGIIEEKMKEGSPKTGESLATEVFHAIFESLPEEFGLEILEYRDIGWECGCSVERLEQVLLSIGETDLRQLAEEDGEAELTCQFCTKRYHFDKDHLEMLLRVAVKSKEIIEDRKKKMEETQC
ncbi:MAG: Hsp33 family molecular chaperone HslO [Anaerovoracaceae bacterium]